MKIPVMTAGWVAKEDYKWPRIYIDNAGQHRKRYSVDNMGIHVSSGPE